MIVQLQVKSQLGDMIGAMHSGNMTICARTALGS